MTRRHRNSDHGWNKAGVPDRGIKIPSTKTMRANFKAFAKRHKMPVGKFGRLEVEE